MTAPDHWPDERLHRETARRRDELLEELRPVVAARPRRRQAVRAAGLLFITGVAGGVWTGTRGQALRTNTAPAVSLQPVEHPAPVAAIHQPPAHAPTTVPPSVTYIDTTPDLAASMSVKVATTDRIDDAQLLAALQSAGQAPSLVRIDGRVVVAGDFRTVPPAESR